MGRDVWGGGTSTRQENYGCCHVIPQLDWKTVVLVKCYLIYTQNWWCDTFARQDSGMCAANGSCCGVKPPLDRTMIVPVRW